jgi:trehalose 6-phosphate phosphatase
MKYLFDVGEGMIEEVRSHSRRAFFLDYDGTLTPIVREPSKAFLPSQYREVIASVVAREGNFVCIISGRSIEQLREFIGLKDLFLAGNHGMEISGPDVAYVNEEALREKPLLEEIADTLRTTHRDFEGAVVEEKGLTVSLHYRMVPERQHPNVKRSFSQAMAQFLASNAIIVTGGKKILEVRPNVVWNKGSAVEWLLGYLSDRSPEEKPYPTYIGDDETDEDGFRALKSRGLTILVSPRKRSSEASYFIRDVEEVYRFLQFFIP